MRIQDYKLREFIAKKGGDAANTVELFAAVMVAGDDEDGAFLLVNGFHDGVEFVKGFVLSSLLDERVCDEEGVDGAGVCCFGCFGHAVRNSAVFGDFVQDAFDKGELFGGALLSERSADFVALEHFVDGALVC